MSNLDNYWQSEHDEITLETRTILNEYLLSMKLSNKAEATIKKYRWILERFFRECTIPLNELTSNDVLHWLNEFSEGKKPKTIDLFLSAISCFFQFCLAEEYMDTLVIKKRWRPKIPQALPKYLTEQEYTRVKLTAEGLSLRNRSLILFLFSSGCRSSEASYLNIPDVELEKRTAIVRGKGKKIRHIHFSEECALVLKEYLTTRSGDLEGPLFKNKFGQRLTKSGIYLITTRLGKKAGLNQILHPQKASDVRAWLASMEEQGLKPRTIHLKLSALKSFFKYCMEENKATKNPTLTVHTPQKDDSLPYYLSKRQVTLLQELTRNDPRDRAIVETLYTTGVRVSELLQIKLEDIKWETRQI